MVDPNGTHDTVVSQSVQHDVMEEGEPSLSSDLLPELADSSSDSRDTILDSSQVSHQPSCSVDNVRLSEASSGADIAVGDQVDTDLDYKDQPPYAQHDSLVCAIAVPIGGSMADPLAGQSGNTLHYYSRGQTVNTLLADTNPSIGYGSNLSSFLSPEYGFDTAGASISDRISREDRPDPPATGTQQSDSPALRDSQPNPERRLNDTECNTNNNGTVPSPGYPPHNQGYPPRHVSFHGGREDYASPQDLNLRDEEEENSGRSFQHADTMPLPQPSRRNQSAIYHRDYHSTLALPDGHIQAVGSLQLDYVENPARVWPMHRDQSFYFLSHNGGDAKEQIARPTYWFIDEVLKVSVFMDDECMAPGSDKMRILVEKAHRCTHAMVIVTPSFRRSKYCVMELNTFMDRWRAGDGIRLIPALWGVDGIEEYNDALNDITWLHGGSYDAAEYMIGTLWPHIMRDLNHTLAHTLGRRELDRILVRYVEVNRGRPTGPIPSSLEQFVLRHRSSNLPSCSCAIS